MDEDKVEIKDEEIVEEKEVDKEEVKDELKEEYLDDDEDNKLDEDKEDEGNDEQVKEDEKAKPKKGAEPKKRGRKPGKTKGKHVDTQRKVSTRSVKATQALISPYVNPDEKTLAKRITRNCKVVSMTDLVKWMNEERYCSQAL